MATQTDKPTPPRPNDGKVTMICPNLTCRKPVTAPESARGGTVRCAHCNAVFKVPTRA
jgi:LSD1 subclass zinc finger protein